MTTEAQEKELEVRDQKKEKEKHLGTRTGEGQIARLKVASYTELNMLATTLAASDIVPKDMIGKPANVLLALMFGNEIGLTPAQALQNVMVVNGRPSLWGDAVMGLVLASGLQEWWKDEYKPDVDGGTWYFTTKRVGQEPVTRSFSEKDAVAAKLDKKPGPWQEYKPRMKFHRCRSWGLRDVYGDVLKGIRYYEEERDVIDTTATRTAEYELPKPKTATSAPAPAPAPAAAAQAAPPPAPAPSEGKEEVFKVGYSAQAKLEEGKAFVVSDDGEPPVKYYHNNEDWAEIAKAAREAKAYVTVRWTERKTAKGPVRWLESFSLKS